MAERFHLGPGTLAYARALGFEIPSGGHQALALEPEAYYALFESSETEAATLYPKVIDCFGFATLDPPLLIGLCSENLETAAERMARYKPLIGPLSLTLRRSEATLRLTFDWSNAPAVPALAYAIEALFWVALARKGPLDRQTPLSLSLPMCPPARAEFESVAGLRVTIAEQQEITFTAKAARAFRQPTR